MLKVVATTLLAVATAACGSTAEGYEDWSIEPIALQVDPRLYFNAAWIEDEAIALGTASPDSSIFLVDDSGSEVRNLTPVEMPLCRPRDLMGFAVTPEHHLGYADVCLAEGVETVIFTSVSPGGVEESRGRGSEVPLSTAWSADGSIVYSTGTSICTTLYRRNDTIEPVSLNVEIDGQRFAAGQDLDATRDGCPVGGRAGFPAYTPDGRRLAFLASADGNTPQGPELSDQPWSLFVDRDGIATTIVSGLMYPSNLEWVPDGRHVVFSGTIFGRRGVWCIDTVGSSVALVSDLDTNDLSVNPSGQAVVAITGMFRPDGLFSDSSQVVTLDLGDRCRS